MVYVRLRYFIVKLIVTLCLLRLSQQYLILKYLIKLDEISCNNTNILDTHHPDYLAQS
jgi:hypothetical protein